MTETKEAFGWLLTLKKIGETIKSYVNDVRNVMPVDKVVLFGSYAKGIATEQSDIDICFFLPNFAGKRRVDVLYKLLDLTHKYNGVYFEPAVFLQRKLKKAIRLSKKF